MSSPRLALSISLCFLAAIACNHDVSILATEAEGDDPGECDDGADNDEDGDFDCDDEDCEGSPACDEDTEEPGDSEPPPPDNNPPSAPELGVDPSCVEADQDVSCSVTVDSVDPDGDEVGYAYAWSADSGASASGAQLRANQTTAGEYWTCTVTPSDPWEDGPTASAGLQVHGPCETHLDTSFDSGLSGWQTVGGDVSASGGYVELRRTSDSWAAATWDGSRQDAGQIDLTAQLSVHADQALVGVCVTDGRDGEGIEIPGQGHWGSGYCMLLSTETQNGSQQGAFLMSGDATGNATILASSTFTPSQGTRYRLSLTRSCAGEMSFQVDGTTVGSATNTYATEFSRLIVYGGEDDYTSDFPGGRVHSLRFDGCE